MVLADKDVRVAAAGNPNHVREQCDSLVCVWKDLDVVTRKKGSPFISLYGL